MGFSLRARALGVCFLLTGLGAVACGDDDSSAGVDTGEGGEAPGGAGGSAGSEAVGGADGANGGAPVAGTSASEGGAGASGGTTVDFLDRLEHLGADTGLKKEPRDQDGKALPEGYHPLRKPFATLASRQEIFYSGPTFDGRREGIIDDGFDGNFRSLLTPERTAWVTAKFRSAVAADIDGDGVQEFVGVYWDAATKQLMAKIVHGPRGKKAAFDEAPVVLADAPTAPNIFDDWFQHCVAAANVDDDPADELVVAFRDLYFFDDANHGLRELTDAREVLQSDFVTVVKGDFDAAPSDERDELFVTFGAPGPVMRYQVYDGLDKVLVPEGVILRPTLAESAHRALAFQQGFAITGEFDGDDPEQEIAFVAWDGGWKVMLMDDLNANFRTFNSFMAELSGDDASLAAADIDGDGVDELFAVDWIFDGLEKLNRSSDNTEVTSVAQTDKITLINPLINSKQVRRAAVSRDLGTPQIPGVQQFISIDGPRIVYSARNPTRGNEFTWVSLGAAAGGAYGDVLAAGNVDDDSPVLRFTGERELLYSQPELLVAMAAPPFYAGTNQESTSSTSFGQGEGETVEKESTVGYSVGFSFGYESEDPFGIAKSSFTVSVSAEFDAVAKNAATQSQLVTYTSGAEDSVVFTVVPFDVYYYEVVAAPNASEVGNKIAINIPRRPQTLLASAEYFDRYVDDSRKSQPLFATHVVGEPLSYSTGEEMDELCGGYCFKSADALPVGQGTGYTTVEISQSESEGVGASYKLSTEIVSEASLGGVKVGASVGFSYGFAMETTTETTTVFTGQLGSLKELTPAKGYKAGLFAHRQAHPASIKPVLVVDYWVEQ